MRPYLDYFDDVVLTVAGQAPKAVTMDLHECRYCGLRQKCPGSPIPHKPSCPVTVLTQVAELVRDLPGVVCELHGLTRKARHDCSFGALEEAECTLAEAFRMLDVRPCEACHERPVWERWRNELLCSRCFEERSLEVAG